MENELLDKKYRIIELIGSGGMADVYKALNLSNRHIVAIKMLKGEFVNDAEFTRRFEREARATLQLAHDNVVRAYGVGTHNGRPYIVLEYVEGTTLKQLISESGAMPPRVAIGLCCQILDALAAAHMHGIVHRDVKPQNVLVTPRGKAKLADFGIARELSSSTVTFGGSQVLGSVHYISPEQARGEAVSQSSDIYSVGVTLYEMLTGTVPFTADSAVSVALMHLQNEPRPPKELNPEIPQALNDIVMKAMTKKVQDRYRTVRAMRMDLVRSLTDPEGSFVRERDEEPEFRPPSKRTSRISPYAWIGIAVAVPILFILISFVGFSTGLFGKDSQTDDVPGVETPVASPTSIIVSNDPNVTASALLMPAVIGSELDKALHDLKDAGVGSIYVKFGYTAPAGSDPDKINNSVTAQSVKAGEPLEAYGSVTLWVFRKAAPQFKADVSFNVDVPTNSTLIQLVYLSYSVDNVPYYVILFETARAAEQGAVITAQVYSSEPAGRTLFLMINSEKVDSQLVSFS